MAYAGIRLFICVILPIPFISCTPSAWADPAASGKALEIRAGNADLLKDIGSHPDLVVLFIVCLEELSSLPDSIGKPTKLKELTMNNGNGCAMNPILPEAIGNLSSLEKLDLYGAQDPRRFGVQPSQRHAFPQSMSQLKNLTYLDLGRNGLDEIPPFVKDLTKLKELRLELNDLKDLSDFLGTLPALTLITLRNNCESTQNEAKIKDLKHRFSKITIDFTDEYDCPGQ